MSEPVLRCESSEVSAVIDAVADLLAEKEIRGNVSIHNGAGIHAACVEADRRAGLIVPPALARLSLFTPDVDLSDWHRKSIALDVERHVRAELRGSLGLIGTLLLRWVIGQVVTWLVEWFFSRYATAYRNTVASKG